MSSLTSTGFISNGCHCAADLYLPETAGSPAVIVMAHGFGGERLAGLPTFAQRFCDAGYAVFLFDYRYFGDSEGEPRQLVSPWRQLADWRAAIAHVRTLESVNAERMVLWGTSFSGGHVVSIACEDHRIRAIISQVPFTSGLKLASQTSLADTLHMMWAGIKDFACTMVGAGPHYYPIIAHPGEHAFLNTEDSYDGYLSLFDKNSQWVNRVPARINLQVSFYNPAFKADRIQCPALVLAGSKDSLIPVETVKSMAEQIPLGEYHEMPVGHFEPYTGSCFEDNITRQLEFLRKLQISAAQAPGPSGHDEYHD